MLRNLFLFALYFASLFTKPVVITTYTLHCEDNNDSFSDDDIELTVAINGQDGSYGSTTPQIGFSGGQSTKIKGTFVCNDDAYAQFSLLEDDMFKDDHASFKIKCSDFPATYDYEHYLHFHFDEEQLSIPITYGLLQTEIGINYEGGAYILYLNIKGADKIIGDYIYQHSAIEINRILSGTSYYDQGLFLKNQYLLKNNLYISNSSNSSSSTYVNDSISTFNDPVDNNNPFTSNQDYNSQYYNSQNSQNQNSKDQNSQDYNSFNQSNTTVEITYEAVYESFETQYFRSLQQGFEVEASMKLIFNWLIIIFFFQQQFF